MVMLLHYELEDKGSGHENNLFASRDIATCIWNSQNIHAVGHPFLCIFWTKS